MRIKRKPTPQKDKKRHLQTERERKKTGKRQKELGRVIFREWAIDS